MKKLICFVVLIVIIISVPMSALAATNLIITTTASSTDVKAGDVIDVKIAFENYNDTGIPGISGFQLDVDFKNDYFEFVESSEKNLLKTNSNEITSLAYNNKTNTFVYMYLYNSSDSLPLARSNKDIFSFKMKILKDIPIGKTEELKIIQAIGDTSSPSKPIATTVQTVKIKSSKSSNTGETESKSASKQNQSGGNESVAGNDISIDLKDNSNKNTPWDKVVVSGQSKDTVLTETENGVVISGGDLSNLTVTVKNGDKTETVKIATDKDKVIIKEENGELVVYTDEDGTGDFNKKIDIAEVISESENQPEPGNNTWIYITIIAIAIIAIAATSIFIINMRKNKKTDIQNDESSAE